MRGYKPASELKEVEYPECCKKCALYFSMYESDEMCDKVCGQIKRIRKLVEAR